MIAERLELSRVTLYRYCPSKEELLSGLERVKQTLSSLQHQLQAPALKP